MTSPHAVPDRPTRSPVRRSVAVSLLVGVVVGLLGLPGPAASAAGATSPGPSELAVTVTGPGGAALDGSLGLYQWDEDQSLFVWSDEIPMAGGSPLTDAFAVDEGAWFAYFDDQASGGAGYSGGVQEPPDSPIDPGVVTVTRKRGASVAITVEAPGGLVTGRVVDRAGSAVAATLTPAENPAGRVGTAADGRFSVDLPVGAHTLQVQPADDALATRAVPVTVASTSSTVALGDVVLAPVGRWTLSGAVRTAAGRPAAGAEVTLLELTDATSDTQEWRESASTTTDAAGGYTLPQVLGGRTYTVEVTAAGHRTTYLGGSTALDDADVVTPTADLDLPTTAGVAASTLSGRVTGPDGPATGVEVRLQRLDETTRTFRTVSTGVVDATGRYAVTAAEPGTYTAYLDPTDAAAPLAAAYLGGGTSAPTGAGAPGILTIGETATDLVRDLTLTQGRAATGTVTGPDGTPLAGAAVTAYVADPGSGSGALIWDEHAEAVSRADGSYAVKVPAGARVTVGFAAPGHLPVFLGGGAALPTATEVTTSRVAPTATDLVLGTTALQRRPTSLGRVAGQRLDFCDDHALPLGPGLSSGPITLPDAFPLKLDGTPARQLYVGADGTLTFGAPSGSARPRPLAQLATPTIAALWGDADPRVGGEPATWGFSADGTSFCAVWADQGSTDPRDGQRRNTAQVVLRYAGTDASRVPGDVDVTWNYDRVEWDGAATGRPVRAGITAGTGSASTTELPGSGVAGALLDGGTQALTTHSLASGTPGRYVVAVRNAGRTNNAGDLRGSVVDDLSGRPLTGATVRVCRAGAATPTCLTRTTDATGAWVASDQLAGDVELTVSAADHLPASATAAVTAGVTTTVPVVRLQAPVALRASAVDQWGTPVVTRFSLLRTDGGAAGVDDVTGDQALWPTLRPGAYRVSGSASGCGTATSDVTLVGDPVTVVLRLTCDRSPSPLTAPRVDGTARVGEQVTATDAVWPSALTGSGVVLLRDGVVVPGARHTLGVDDVGAVFTAVATARSASGSSLTATSATVVGARGAAAEALAAPQVSGAPRLGSVLTATTGGWAAGGLTHTTSWTRDGEPIAGADQASYRLSADDLGHRVGAVVAATRPGYDDGSARSAAVTVLRAASTTAARLPATKVRRWRAPTVMVTVAAPGLAGSHSPGGTFTVRDGSRTIASGPVRAGAVKVRLPRLRPGVHRLTVVYRGDALVEGSRSRTVLLRVLR